MLLELNLKQEHVSVPMRQAWNLVVLQDLQWHCANFAMRL